MRRRLAALLLFTAVLFGGLAAQPASAAPDRPTDYVSSQTTLAICQVKGVQLGLGGWYVAYQTVHYGTAHVTQCWYRTTAGAGQGTYSHCWQYVWGPGVRTPYWDHYGSGFYPAVDCF